MHNIPSCFQFEKYQKERMPLSEYTNNRYTLTRAFLGLFSSGYTFKRKKPLART